MAEGAKAGAWTVVEVAPTSQDGPRIVEISDGVGRFITQERPADLMVCIAEFLGVKSWSQSEQT